MSDAPIFIVGCPRSGTTLLRNLLRSHPRLTFPRESHFWPRFYRAYGDPRNEHEACRLAGRILFLHWVRCWDLELTPRAFRDCRSYAEVVATLYRAWAATENKPRWGDKTPQYVRAIPLLRRLFPDCQIIHIIRDGRDTALSWTRQAWGPHNLYAAARGWREFVQAGREAGRALPARAYLEIRYEDLIRSPRDTMQQVCVYLGEAYSEAVLRPTPIRTRYFASPWKPPGAAASEILQDHRQKWKQALTRADRVVFESVAGPLLNDLSYETEGLAAPLSRFQVACWRAHAFLGYYASRLRLLGHSRWLAGELLLRAR